ncbi:DNA double-strand break repair nuclease NurA [Metallosphaera tengchongensis]|uniref:DNA double-strand break repair nuclease NurA n=1 Tax=Metallosphaera tengchongensis TaxID=1532350 RepID=A0A6N0NXD3_9CREN|nr:DNA double-strand break repair nuclease NurA [Metallosphaera tengchongensis]QKQ99759.1 DNA double-strand break repair nuclease NurA [Metallosphaera tengchongensis]
MSVISESGVSNTVVRLENENNYIFDKVAAVDGSLHEFYTEEGLSSYVNACVVFFDLKGNLIRYLGSKVREMIVNGKGEEAMRRIEYEEANSISDTSVIFMDRKLTMDVSLGLKVPDSVIAIVKDFDQLERRKLTNIPKAPWLILDEGEIRQGYVKLKEGGWVFRLETNVRWDKEKILALLYLLSREPIPEALGYNYPLYLVDKMAKFYRDRAKRALDFLSNKQLIRYRSFRSLVEGRRNSWSSNQ